MVKLIVGKKGAGKTKVLIQMANEAVKNSKGSVAFIEKGNKLTYDITHKARLIDIDSYAVNGFDAFYGFVCGLCAANYDLTDILIDGTLKIGGPDLDAFSAFAAKLKVLSGLTQTDFVLSVSADAADLAHVETNIVTP